MRRVVGSSPELRASDFYRYLCVYAACDGNTCVVCVLGLRGLPSMFVD